MPTAFWEQGEVEAFWEVARMRANLNNAPGYLGINEIEALMPPAWSFGGSSGQANELAALVVAGAKTATASAVRDYETEDVPLPEVGDISILLDGNGVPRALLCITAVEVVPFGEVPEEHAVAEGEGDLSVVDWRGRHEDFFIESDPEGRPVTEDMPVVLERFTVLYSDAG